MKCDMTLHLYAINHCGGGWKNTYESISSGLSSLPVGDDDSLFDFAVDFKVLPKRFVGRVIGKSANEQFGPSGVFLTRRRR